MFRLFVNTILIDNEQANAGIGKRPVRIFGIITHQVRHTGIHFRLCAPVGSSLTIAPLRM